jgi:hypothetical protein
LGGGGSCGPNGLIQQHLQQQQHYRRGLRGSFKDPANNDNNSYADAMGPASDPAAVAAVAALELYHRCARFFSSYLLIFHSIRKEGWGGRPIHETGAIFLWGEKMMMDEL